MRKFLWMTLLTFTFDVIKSKQSQKNIESFTTSNQNSNASAEEIQHETVI